MNTELELQDTRKVVIVGTGLGVNLKKDIVQALGIVQGSLIKITIQNTGVIADIKSRKKDVSEVTEVEV